MLQNHPSRTLTALAIILCAALLTGCGPTGAEPEKVTPSEPYAFPKLRDYPGVSVTENLTYSTVGTESLMLDACTPPVEASKDKDSTDEASTNKDSTVKDSRAVRPAIILVHGGSWRAGDKASAPWRNVCRWLASEGFVVFSVNYRLAPVFPYPAQIEDVRAAARWIRQPQQVDTFNIDPKRIGAFGGSAGGNLVALLGAEGSGGLTSGSRVAAVVDLSGPTDLTAAAAKRDGVSPKFQKTQASYLGCASLEDCPAARQASPVFDVDPTDPPFFIAQSTKELIPIGQSTALVAALRDNRIDTTFIAVKGNLHSMALLDDPMKKRIADFLRSTLTVG